MLESKLRMAEDTNLDLEPKPSKRILILEDDPAVARLLRAVLEGSGYQLTLLESAEEGIEHIKANVFPDLAITDKGLKGNMSGLKFIEQVGNMAAAQEMKAPPVGIVSGGILKEEIEVYRGKTSFILTKPFRPNDLTDAVKTAFDDSVKL